MPQWNECGHWPVDIVQSEADIDTVKSFKYEEWVSIHPEGTHRDDMRGISISNGLSTVWVNHLPYTVSVLMRNSGVAKVGFGEFKCEGYVDLADLIATHLECDIPSTLQQAVFLMDVADTTYRDYECPHCRALLIGNMYKRLLERGL